MPFAVDRLGDVYLVGRVPLAAVDRRRARPAARGVLTYADEAFDTLLEIGFASSIRREWDWRHRRGEPTGNLEPFRHLPGGRPTRPTDSLAT